MFIIVLTLEKMHRLTWGHTASEDIWSSQWWLSQLRLNCIALWHALEDRVVVNLPWEHSIQINTVHSFCDGYLDYVCFKQSLDPYQFFSDQGIVWRRHHKDTHDRRTQRLAFHEYHSDTTLLCASARRHFLPTNMLQQPNRRPHRIQFEY